MAPDRGSKPSSARKWEDVVPTLPSWIIDAMLSMNFPKMTPVQASTIPLFMAHKDVVVEAVTGSGKTLAFLIPLVDRILRLEEATKKHHIATIVISPTRELATQIHNVLLALLAFHGPSAAAIDASKRLVERDYDDHVESDESALPVFPANIPKVLPQLLLGGSNTASQDLSKFLKIAPNILISTPGRLLEILSSPYVHAPQSSFEVLVLDEADRLLDLGFKDDLTKILALLPKQRRTGLFSASISEAVDQIIRVGLRNPVRIAVKVRGVNGVQDKNTPASLKMTYILTDGSQKIVALKELLHKVQPQPLRTIVYLSTCAAVNYFQHLLPLILPDGMTLVPLHGKHPSNVREKNFAKFSKTPSPTILLTTDVAARGLDIAFVDLVVQIDPPSDPKVFIHRCGRAGRAGRKGLSVVFLQPGREEEYIPFLEVRKTPIEKLADPEIHLDTAEALEISQKFRSLVLEDRAVHDKGQRAFVSWVRSYSKHQASSIFRVVDLDWESLVQGWALLKLPKMPEARKSDLSGLELPKVDWDDYSYKDKSREKVRKENMIAQSEAPQDRSTAPKRSVTDAWSEKQEQKISRDMKRSKREARREYIRTTKMNDEEKARVAETQDMIARVREQQRLAKEEDDNFEGFE